VTADRARLRLHVLTDQIAAGARSDEEIARAALAGGATVIQLRGKSLSGAELARVGRALRQITREAGALLIVNDRVDIALAVDADGVHLGQDDMPAEDARRLIGPRRILGLSASTIPEVVQAAAAGADYIGFGPVFATGSKPDARAPTGLALLRQAVTAVGVPIVAIGGIDNESAGAVMATGVAGVAVIAAVVAAPDAEAAARSLRQLLEKGNHA
jgi:thiamine-phosphate pyrophosphorylase